MPNEPGTFDRLIDWFLINGVNFLIDLAVFGLIILFGLLLIKQILAVTRKALEKSGRFTDILVNFFVNVLHKILVVVLFMIALPRLGIEVAPLIAGLGVTGFIVGFAFQESLGNLAAGLMLLLNNPFQIGDYVEAGGVSGTVVELNMMATTLNTPDNKRVIVPNNKIWGGPITNYSALPTRRVDLKVAVSYGADIAKAIETLQDVLKGHELVLDDPAPTIAVDELAGSSVNLVVRPWVNNADYWTVHFEITRAMKERLKAANVEIPIPKMDVHVKELAKSA